jgi:hypothetical protein
MSRRTLAMIALAVLAVASIMTGTRGTRTSAIDGSMTGTVAGHPASYGVVGADQAAGVPLRSPAPPPQATAGNAAEAAATEPVASSGRVLSGSAMRASKAGTEPELAAMPSQVQQAGSMLIRSGHAQIEVDSVQVGIARVRRLAQETGALVANTTLHTGREQQRSASLELRIPSERFDAVVNGLTPIGKVESVNVSAQDVGEEFVDLTARLANARRLEARLIELLANRTGRLSDVLTVERELARIRETIERYEGRLRYLQSRVAVSSLTIQVHEPAPVVASHPGENVIAEAFVEAWRRFVLITAGLIASLGVVVPVAALALAAWVIARRYLPAKARVSEQAAG